MKIKKLLKLFQCVVFYLLIFSGISNAMTIEEADKILLTMGDKIDKGLLSYCDLKKLSEIADFVNSELREINLSSYDNIITQLHKFIPLKNYDVRLFKNTNEKIKKIRSLKLSLTCIYLIVDIVVKKTNNLEKTFEKIKNKLACFRVNSVQLARSTEPFFDIRSWKLHLESHHMFVYNAFSCATYEFSKNVFASKPLDSGKVLHLVYFSVLNNALNRSKNLISAMKNSFKSKYELAKKNKQKISHYMKSKNASLIEYSVEIYYEALYDCAVKLLQKFANEKGLSVVNINTEYVDLKINMGK